MAAASDVSPQSAYIQHHLVHLNNIGEKQSVIAQFNVINYDSVFWSALTGLVVVLFLWLAARRASAGVPGRFQAFVEMLVDMVDAQAKSIVTNAKSRIFVAPPAPTLFPSTIPLHAPPTTPFHQLPHSLAPTPPAAAHARTPHTTPAQAHR